MFITILTPTYNRLHTLNRLYHSLEGQNFKEFEWLIVDDGSTDNTESYINHIKNIATFRIRYISKINGGKHTAINKGIENIDSLLTFIVDSDDYLVDNAVEVIKKSWDMCTLKNEISAIWFLQSDTKGDLIGDRFSEDYFISTYTEVLINSGNKGDKKVVYLTDIHKNYPFPVFKNEKFIGEGLIHKKIGNNYRALFVNEIIYKGDYLNDGLSKAGREMRILNPLGGMANSKEFLTRDVKLKIRIKKMVLFCTYGFFAGIKIKDIIIKSGQPVFSLMCITPSFFLYKKWNK